MSVLCFMATVLLPVADSGSICYSFFPHHRRQCRFRTGCLGIGFLLILGILELPPCVHGDDCPAGAASGFQGPRT